MRVNGAHYRSIWLDDSTGLVHIIDQTRLPFEFEVVPLAALEAFTTAIHTMQVRGAPLIGATAAYGIAVSMREASSDTALVAACETLYATRPTAVNLRWAIEWMYQQLAALPEAARAARAFELAEALCTQDIATNQAIGAYGKGLIEAAAASKGAGEPVNILTHCNAGWLATVDWGTALAPIYKAHEAGIAVQVWVDETRPRNQGASLTAWELGQQGIAHHVIADNAGGHLMQTDQVDLCLVGSDRTTASGDVCNKIGTYLKALAAFDNHVPFCVALPSSTIDWRIGGAEASNEDQTEGEQPANPSSSHSEIPIESRDPREVTHLQGLDDRGQLRSVQLVPDGSPALNPAFDITPAKYVTTLITERGLCAANSKALRELFPASSTA